MGSRFKPFNKNTVKTDVGKKVYNEAEILAALSDKNKRADAFTAIVKQYSQQIYWHVRRMVLSHDDTNDIVQNCFIKAWNSIGNFRGEAQISTWLYRIAINETLSFLAKSRNNTVSLDTPEGAIAEQLESDSYFSGTRADALLQEAVS